MVRYLTLTLAAVLLTGCGMSRDACEQADWRQIGINDGAKGYDKTRFETRQKSCAKHGITPDFDAWNAGRIEGLKIYCTPQMAHRVGMRGLSLRKSCSDEQLQQMQPAHKRGLRYHYFTTEINSLSRERQSLYNELAQVSRDPANAGLQASIRARIAQIDLRITQLRGQRAVYATY